MITNISLVTLYVTDQDEAKEFYTEVLGFAEGTDVQMGEGFRWVTVSQAAPSGAPGHPAPPLHFGDWYADSMSIRRTRERKRC